jgi:colicin import membrane protein
MINYLAPLCLSLIIHFGIVLSFSDFFNINFDQFNIQSSKPISAYIIFEEKKNIRKNPIKLNEVTQKKEKKVEKQDIEISSSASILEEIQQLEETRLVDVKEIDKNLLRTDVEKYSYLIQRQVRENWKRPKNINQSLKTEIQINLVPTGEILSASVIKSSGNNAFDESAMSAILKVKSFEGLTMQMQLFDQHFRKFTLVFTPE